jgi:glycosyltransferase involved in cell wall biosynthesis
MHVGLNLVFLTPGEQGGMEIYARELIARLAARDDLRLTAFTNRSVGDWPGVPSEVIPVRPKRRVEWVRGEQQFLPRAAARAGCDLLHNLASTAPLHRRVPSVTTIHDLAYRLVPEAHFGVNALGMRVLVGGAARRSRRIIAVSQATRDDIVAHLGVGAEKVDVVPNGLPPISRAPTPEAELRARLDLGDRPVLLTVSAKRPHKNLPRLIDALAGLPQPRPVLVMPGYPTQHDAELRDQAARLGVSDDVRLLGWLSDADLEGLYALAGAVVFPSLFEGFGLPVLEAMARGVPLACSDLPVLREVAGDAAVFFDPTDVAAIRAAIGRVLAEGAPPARGRERAAEFTWERTAELTVASYARALASARP